MQNAPPLNTRITLRLISQLTAIAVFATLAALGVSGYVFLGIALGVVALSFFIGPAFCGWACPVGAIQDVLGLPLRNRRLAIPKWLDRVFAWYRYVILVLIVILALTSGTQVLQNFSPFGALYDFATSTALGTSAIIGLSVLALLSVVLSRPFCRYLCPYGAMLGLSNLVRLMPLRRVESTCTDCGACDRVCPMNIEVMVAGDLRDVRCISCLECSSEGGSCPQPRTLRLAAPSAWKVVVWAAIALLVVVAFVGYNSWMGSQPGAMTCPSTTCVGTVCHAIGTGDSGESDGYSAVTPSSVLTCPSTGCTSDSCHATENGESMGW